MDWVRGDYKSIRYRFYILPRDWSIYLTYRLLGRSWTRFYAYRMDREGRKAKVDRVPTVYLKNAEEHFTYLKTKGLKPEHRFLDYGCGVMRTGLYVAKYLNPGNYVGVDISAERLRLGRMLAEKHGLPPDHYKLITVTDCHVEELAGYEFDYIWVHSVISHMPPDEVRLALTNLRPLLANGGQIIFDFRKGDRLKRKFLKDWCYPTELMQRVCEDAGYHFEIQPDYNFTEYSDDAIDDPIDFIKKTAVVFVKLTVA